MSVWPNNLTFTVGKPTPKIPPEISANMKMMDFVGYAPNPKTIKRNQILSISYKQASVGPKFRSEKDRERVFGKQQGKGGTAASASNHDLHSIVPKCYTKVNIKYSRFGVEDFDFSFYNQTEYGGLENHIRNEYCNSMLQVLFYIPNFRQLCKAHLCTPCQSPVCLTCELGFLFRMLEDAKGLNCQASNFLKAFSNIPQGIIPRLYYQKFLKQFTNQRLSECPWTL